MKNLIYFFVLILLSGCDDSNDTDLSEPLSKTEIENLQYLKEEEKLARDVYLYAHDLYGQIIFENIANSEQAHMNSVTVMLDKYGIQDLSYEARGVFYNQGLQNLYKELTSLVDKSVQEALFVGATIEDLDIFDLNNFMDTTDYEDLQNLYEVLSCGSKNHMRAFSQDIVNSGGVYVAQYISEEDYALILASDMEKCGN